MKSAIAAFIRKWCLRSESMNNVPVRKSAGELASPGSSNALSDLEALLKGTRS